MCVQKFVDYLKNNTVYGFSKEDIFTCFSNIEGCCFFDRKLLLTMDLVIRDCHERCLVLSCFSALVTGMRAG